MLSQGYYKRKLQNGGKTVITRDPNDPRLKAYKDSLTYHKAGEEGVTYLRSLAKKYEANELSGMDAARLFGDYVEKDKKKFDKFSKAIFLKPISEYEVNFDGTIAVQNRYKSPVQPIELQIRPIEKDLEYIPKLSPNLETQEVDLGKLKVKDKYYVQRGADGKETIIPDEEAHKMIKQGLHGVYSRKRRMQDGGGISPQGYMLAGDLAGDLVAGTPNQYGVQKNAGLSAGLKGAGQGATAGALIGSVVPGVGTAVGAAAGAVIGGTFSVIKAGSDQRKAREFQAREVAKQNALAQQMEHNRTKAFWAANPNFSEGTLATSYYRMGGKIKKPYKAYGGSTPVGAGSNGTEFVGPSHEEGGIDIGPAVVEGGETMDQDFIFSKELGFADKHKKLMKKLDILSKKAPTAPTQRTVESVRSQIENLKVEQEAMKAVAGIPNDLDGSSGVTLSQQYMGRGGKVRKALGGGLNPELDEDQLMRDRQKLSEQMRFQIPTDPSQVDDSGALTSLQADTFMKAPVTPAIDDISAPAGRTRFNPNNLVEGFTAVAPYLTNILNSREINKLPAPPAPRLTTPIAVQGVDYSAQKEDARSTFRANRQLAEKYLTSGSAIAANAAVQGVNQARELGRISQAEQNANAEIRNRVAAVNANIETGNNALINQYNQDNVNFAMTKSTLRMQNRADAIEKFLTQARDQKAMDVDKMRLSIALLQDTEGVSWRQLEPVISDIYGPNSKQYKSMRGIFEEREGKRRGNRTADLNLTIPQRGRVPATAATTSAANVNTATAGNSAPGAAPAATSPLAAGYAGRRPTGSSTSELSTQGAAPSPRATNIVKQETATTGIRSGSGTPMSSQEYYSRRLRPTNDVDKVGTFEEAERVLASDDLRRNNPRYEGNLLSPEQRKELETRVKLYRPVYLRYSEQVQKERRRRESEKATNRQLTR